MRPDVLIANDPDADRLGAAIPDGDGGYRALRGDEIGVLLGRPRAAAHLRFRSPGRDDRRVVDDALEDGRGGRRALRRDADRVQVDREGGLDRPDMRFVFGYEEALGYLVGDVVRDKDGISAAMILAEIAALAKAEGVSLQDRSTRSRAAHGLHATDQWSVRLEGAKARARIAVGDACVAPRPAGRASRARGAAAG